ncbi:MAG: hypothetical protein L0287_38400, partial [Anaerolineae bacterium]|nr:hypothetical protein [Anaerolineae bacterium]
MKSRYSTLIRPVFLVGILIGLLAQPQHSVSAATAMTITPITWNIIGLDSNNVNVGPNHFPVGARVCNTSTAGETLTGVTSSFALAGTNPYISPRPGTSSSYSGVTVHAKAGGYRKGKTGLPIHRTNFWKGLCPLRLA